MASHKEGQQRRESIGRIRQLLRSDEDEVIISKTDLMELARHHPMVKWDSSVPHPRRRKNYWRSKEGHEEARKAIAKYHEEHGHLPNSTGLMQLGIGHFLQSNGIGSRGYNPVLQYVRFLHHSGYTAEDIVEAHISIYGSVQAVSSALAPATPRYRE